MAIYLKIGDIEGNSKDDKHDKWIELENWSWGVSIPSDVGMGTGAARGTSHLSAVNVSCATAKATINLHNKCCLGDHYDEAVIECTKRTGDEGEGVWHKITLRNVMLTDFSTSASGDFSSDSFAIEYEECEQEIFEQDKTGALASVGVGKFNRATRKG